jgi:hypothetical protein
VALALLAAVYFVGRVLIPSFSTESYGLPAYYTASRLVLEGHWSTQIYQDEWFAEQVRAQTGGRIVEYFSGHPPVTSLLMLPLAGLPLAWARPVWALLNLIFLLTALLLIHASLYSTRTDAPQNRSRALGERSFPALALLFAVALVYAPVAENVRLGQTYVWQLWLFALALWGLKRQRRSATAFGLGTAAIFKLSGVPIWLWLVVSRRWRELGLSSLVALAWVILSVPVLGVNAWVQFFLTFPQRLAPAGWQANLAYQTTPSFFQHLFVFDAEWNPQPLALVPWLAPLLTALVIASALVVSLRLSRRAPVELGFASALTLGVILFPQAEEYHYSLLLLPLAVAATCLVRARPPGWLIILFLTALVLVALPMPYKDPALSQGWVALLGYPRLYGGWLLWSVLMIEMRMPIVGVPAPVEALA